jgi:hypothetical protein
VPVIVLVGIAIGLIADFVQGAQIGVMPPPFGRSEASFNTIGALHVILSTLGIVLVVTLLVVYARTYRQTRGRFPLGLLAIFSALLFQELVSSPLLSHYLQNTALSSGSVGPVADTFRIVAYIIFLYISLE